MNKSAIARIIIWSAVALISLVCLVFGILGNDVSYGFISTYYENAGLYSVCYGTAEITDDINHIEINWIDGDIKIATHDGENIIISETGYSDDDSRMRYLAEANGHLTIQPRKSKRLISDGSIPEKDLTLLIPTDMAASLSAIYISEIEGKVDISDIQASNVSIEVVNSEISISNVTSNELDIEVASADVQATGSFYDINFESVSGDVKITSAVCPRELEVETVSSDFTLCIPEESEFTVELECIGGDFNSDFAYTKRGDSYVVGEGNASFSIDGVSANVSVKKIVE